MTDFDKKPKNTHEKTPNPSYSDKEKTTAHTYPPSTSKSNWIWVLPLILLTLGLGVFAGKLWGEKESDQPVFDAKMPDSSLGTSDSDDSETVEKPVLTVETVQPKQAVIQNELSADGTISAKTTATVNGKINGVAIDDVLADEGDYVKKGQVLAVFDTDAMEQQFIQAQADLAEARTRYELARRDAQRVTPLLEIGAISQQEVDRYAATADQAAASVAASEARLNNQKVNMQNAKVTAPVDGVISRKNANVGSMPGPEPLFTIIQNGNLEWQAQVNPEELGNITVGTPVTVSLPNNQSVAGQVTRVAPTAEDGSRQVTVYASLANNPNARAGMYQRGTFKLGSHSKVTIPISAVVNQDGYDYVMQVKAVKDNEGKTIHRISRIKVKLGERIGDQVVLLEPLKGDGHIVRQGGSFLNDGDIVRIADNK